MIVLRNVQAKDLGQLLPIEIEGFTVDKAATEEVLISRIRLIYDTFIVAENQGKILGYINGPVINQTYITDDLFMEIKKNPKKGGYQSILGIVVSKQARNQGIARMLMNKMEQLVKENERDGITLTCKQELISFYEKQGFINHGVSESKHGGVRWYNLTKLKGDMK